MNDDSFMRSLIDETIGYAYHDEEYVAFDSDKGQFLIIYNEGNVAQFTDRSLSIGKWYIVHVVHEVLDFTYAGLAFNA